MIGLLAAALSLAEVYAPETTGVPPTAAMRDMCVGADGEVRHYGWTPDGRGGRRRVCAVSRDGGLSWTTEPVAADDPGAMVRSPWSGEWLTVIATPGRAVRVARSPSGPSRGDATVREIDVGDFPYCRQPQPLRGRGRWLCAGQCRPEGLVRDGMRVTCPALLLSRDDGVTWRKVVVSNVVTQADGPHAPDAVPRWENFCCEPTVDERRDGVLQMVVRTSTDNDWIYRSRDGGETWTGPERLPHFFASNTMPTLFRMADGRLLFFWNNTIPLPKTGPVTGEALSRSAARGCSESVFTNRDVLHAAVSSDDGETWAGFREILLNDCRNAPDFRELGNDPAQEVDKSVHQVQAVELPGGKVLIAAGQNVCARRFVLFDPGWLLETRRAEDFRHGLWNVCDHLFVKGPMGNARGWAGHCAWNRVHGARMVPDPDLPENQREVVLLARRRDGGLVSDLPGLVWNFPAARAGVVTVEARLPEGSGGFRLVLCDHWFNPCDVVASESEEVAFAVTRAVVPAEKWVELSVGWDCGGREFSLRVEGRPVDVRRFERPPRFGLSYLHLQLLAKGEDRAGALFRRFEKQ